MKARWSSASLILLLSAGVVMSGCGQKDSGDGQGTVSQLPTAPSSTTSATTPSTPTTPTTSTVAYTQDIKPIVTSSCTRCHGNFGTYAGLMTVVSPGNASSRLVTKTQSGGSMYNYLPADRATNANLIRTWVVNGAPENR